MKVKARMATEKCHQEKDSMSRRSSSDDELEKPTTNKNNNASPINQLEKFILLFPQRRTYIKQDSKLINLIKCTRIIIYVISKENETTIQLIVPNKQKESYNWPIACLQHQIFLSLNWPDQ